MAVQAMGGVRREELSTEPAALAAALAGTDPKVRCNPLWGMRKFLSGWNAARSIATHCLQRSALKSARAWRPRMARRPVLAHARQHNDAEQGDRDLRGWISWAQR